MHGRTVPGTLSVSVCTRCGEAGVDVDIDWAMDGHCEELHEDCEESCNPSEMVEWVDYVRKDAVVELVRKWSGWWATEGERGQKRGLLVENELRKISGLPPYGY